MCFGSSKGGGDGGLGFRHGRGDGHDRGGRRPVGGLGSGRDGRSFGLDGTQSQGMQLTVPGLEFDHPGAQITLNLVKQTAAQDIAVELGGPGQQGGCPGGRRTRAEENIVARLDLILEKANKPKRLC